MKTDSKVFLKSDPFGMKVGKKVPIHQATLFEAPEFAEYNLKKITHGEWVGSESKGYRLKWDLYEWKLCCLKLTYDMAWDVISNEGLDII